MSKQPIQSFSNTHSRQPRGRLLAALMSVSVFILAVCASRDTSWPSLVHPATADDMLTTNAVAKANAFLETLDAKQRDQVLFPYDSAKKSSWSNLPVTMVARNGLA